MIEKKRIGIIGAGPSGISAAKFAIDNEIIPVVFEKKPYIGGLWAHNTAAWENMCAIHSRFTMSFSDFSWPDDAPIIPAVQDVLDYLNSYVENFKLRDYFKFNSNVTSVKQLPNKQWEIEWTNTYNNEMNKIIVDFILFASGLNSMPRIPENETLNQFKGLIMHSSQIKSTRNEMLKAKRVILVGNGLSGIEISSELVGYAKSVVNIFNRPSLILPRIAITKSEENSLFQIVPIDLYLFTREKFYNPKNLTKIDDIRKAKFDMFRKLNPIQTSKEKSPTSIYYDLNSKENAPPRIIIDNKYVSYVSEHKIVAKKTKIKSFFSDYVELEDGSIEYADVIIFCTGYLPNINYMDQELKDKLGFDPDYYKFPILFYKWTFHPDFENAAFINQNVGTFFIASELQSKLALMVFANKKTLPSKEEICEEIEFERSRRLNDYRMQYPYGSYAEIIDKLGKEIGQHPDLDGIEANDLQLFDLFYRNAILSVHFHYNDESKRDRCLILMNEVNEIMRFKYRLNINESSDHNDIYTQAYEEITKSYNLPKELKKYLLKE